jgi:hypothetical protein
MMAFLVSLGEKNTLFLFTYMTYFMQELQRIFAFIVLFLLGKHLAKHVSFKNICMCVFGLYPLYSAYHPFILVFLFI